jgi:hypothetical protein
MIQKGKLSEINPETPMTHVQSFTAILKAKKSMTISDLCGPHDK